MIYRLKILLTKKGGFIMSIRIINMTPHIINMADENGNISKIFKPSGNLIKLSVKTERINIINGIPISKTVFGEPEGLPKEQPRVFYIVSQLVKNALPERKDLLVPSEVVRDDKGQIIGYRSLSI